MGKAKCAVTKTVVKRVLKAAKEVGDVQVVVDFERNTMTLTPMKVGEANCSGSNPWDEVLDRAKNKKRTT